MKKLFLSLLSLSFLLISCASVKTVSEKNTPDSRFLKITENLAIQLSDKNFEAAFMRMNDSFKNIYSLSEFEEKCADFFSALKTPENYTVQFSADQGDFYIYTEVLFTEDKAITLAYNPDSGFPVNIIFNKYTKPEEKTLRAIAEKNFKIGCGMTGYSSQNSAMTQHKYTELAALECSSATSTNLMKPSAVLNQRKSIENLSKGNPEPALDFSNVDPILKWAQASNVKVRGHTLVWHTQTPAWFFKEGYKSDEELVNRDTMIARTDSFIRQYLSYCQDKYPGVVYCWDVVNEAVDPGNGDSESFFRCRKANGEEKNLWFYTIGNDYPEVAFSIARKYAAPEVKLFYNDYGTTDASKRSLIIKLCKSLIEKNLLDGIGMQSYWDMNNPPLSTIAATVKAYGELGVEVQLTEWSMPVKEENEAQLNIQAERYASIFRLLKKLDTDNNGPVNITCVSSFGLIDHYPLYPNDTNNTRWWDTHYNPKPVYHAIKDTLSFE